MGTLEVLTMIQLVSDVYEIEPLCFQIIYSTTHVLYMNLVTAAMRYTECKLTKVSAQALLSDINMDTVDFIPNFDGNEVEPTVLPAKLPILLLNGCAGIAVGMATNIPPHNLGELMDACMAITAANEEGAEEVTDAKLFQMIPGPDFPTGALIMGKDGARKLYKTGNGGVVMRAVTHVEQIKYGKAGKKRAAIIVTELPYQVNKSALLEKIAALVNDKKIPSQVSTLLCDAALSMENGSTLPDDLVTKIKSCGLCRDISKHIVT